jgi:hypothetical protein
VTGEGEWRGGVDAERRRLDADRVSEGGDSSSTMAPVAKVEELETARRR